MIILLLKKRRELTIKTQNKIKIIFKIYFLFSSIILINNIKKFFYSSSADNEKMMTNRKIIKVVYKIDLNKTSEINETINKMLQQLVNIVIK